VFSIVETVSLTVSTGYLLWFVLTTFRNRAKLDRATLVTFTFIAISWLCYDVNYTYQIC